MVKLTFDGVGTPYDIVTVSSSTSLSSYLSASGSVGRYSSVVSITKTLLSASQQQTIIDYQKRVRLHFCIFDVGLFLIDYLLICSMALGGL